MTITTPQTMLTQVIILSSKNSEYKYLKKEMLCTHNRNKDLTKSNEIERHFMGL